MIRQSILLRCLQVTLLLSLGSILSPSSTTRPSRLLAQAATETKKSDNDAQTTVVVEEGGDKATEVKKGDEEEQETAVAEKNGSEGQEPESIYLNFENAALDRVLNYLAEKKKLNVSPHRDLASRQVSLFTHKPLSLDAAWKILLTLLEANNFSIIKVDDLYRVVPSTRSNQEPLPSYFGMDPEQLPASDVMIRYVYLLTNIRTEQAKPIFDQMLQANSVQYNAELNGCIITEKSNCIKAVMKIITELDLGGLRESIQVIRLKETNAQEVADLFNNNIFASSDAKKNPRFISLGSKQQMSYFSASTKVIASPQNNQLILLGTRKNLDLLRSFITKYIDIPLEAPQSRIHIKELKYTQAEDIAPLISAAIAPPPSKHKESQLIGTTKYFEDMVLTAEKSETAGAAASATGGSSTQSTPMASIGAGNRILIACTREDWHRIEDFIDKLDKPQPQVAIEVMFVDLEQDLDLELAANLRNKKPGTLGTGLNFQTQHSQVIPPATGTPPLNIKALQEELQNNLAGVPYFRSTSNAAWFTVGRAAADAKGGIWGVVNSVCQSKNRNILSQPFIVVNNHQTGKIALIHSKRVQGEVEAALNAVQQFIDINATVKVEIKPNINREGTMDLNVLINIDEFVGQSTDRTNREVHTQTSMADGEVLVIGGLIQNKTVEDVNKTPILGDIPLLGNLFRGRTKNTTRNNLYIFIRPSIIKPRFEGNPGDYTQLKLDYAKISIQRSGSFYDIKDPIQRWFFDPTASAPKSTLATMQAKEAEFRQLDDFTEGKYQPSNVFVAQDPFYKTARSRTIQTRQKAIQKKGAAVEPQLKQRKYTLRTVPQEAQSKPI